MTHATKQLAGLLVLAALAGGCNGPASPGADTKAKPAPVVNVNGGTPAVTPPSTPVEQPVSSARNEAAAFLKDLLAGDATSAAARVAVSFKKQLSGSLVFDEEKKLGYSESDVKKYLDRSAKGYTKSDISWSVTSPDRSAESVRGTFTGQGVTVPFGIRLAKDGSAWKVTRFAVGKAPVSTAVIGASTDHAWEREAAIDFLEALLAGDPDQALAMTEMTDAFKQRLPSPSIHDPGLGYAKRDVRDWLNKVRAGFTGAALTATDGTKFTGQLTGGNPADFTLVVVKGPDGACQVDDFVVKK